MADSSLPQAEPPTPLPDLRELQQIADFMRDECRGGWAEDVEQAIAYISAGLRAEPPPDLRRLMETWREEANKLDYAIYPTTARALRRVANELEAALRAAPTPESDAKLKALASAMKKLLPPELMEEVLGYLDPLGAFKNALLAVPSDPPPTWQPIASAPKDLDVLLWWPYWSKRPTIGYWKHDRWIAENALQDTTGDVGEGPTHWMPLPAPPQEQP